MVYKYRKIWAVICSLILAVSVTAISAYADNSYQPPETFIFYDVPWTGTVKYNNISYDCNRDDIPTFTTVKDGRQYLHFMWTADIGEIPRDVYISGVKIDYDVTMEVNEVYESGTPNTIRAYTDKNNQNFVLTTDKGSVSLPTIQASGTVGTVTSPPGGLGSATSTLTLDYHLSEENYVWKVNTANLGTSFTDSVYLDLYDPEQFTFYVTINLTVEYRKLTELSQQTRDIIAGILGDETGKTPDTSKISELQDVDSEYLEAESKLEELKDDFVIPAITVPQDVTVIQTFWTTSMGVDLQTVIIIVLTFATIGYVLYGKKE